MTYLNEFLNTLSGLGPEAFAVVGCIAVGYIVRLIPIISNKWIPAICILVGPLCYPFLTNPGRVSPDSQQPLVRILLTGLILGVTAWILHDKAIAKLETKLFSWFATRSGSKHYRKKEDGTFEEIVEPENK